MVNYRLLVLTAGDRRRGILGVYFFFFKQKTAYEISECDWSSDECSSDLKQKTAYEISECDWSSDVCSSDLSELQSHSEISMPSSACNWSSDRSEEHTSELPSHSEKSYAIFCLKKKKHNK